eukprot:7775366-Alexandrium_andersonii.AAC.1
MLIVRSDRDLSVSRCRRLPVAGRRVGRLSMCSSCAWASSGGAVVVGLIARLIAYHSLAVVLILFAVGREASGALLGLLLPVLSLMLFADGAGVCGIR